MPISTIWPLILAPDCIHLHRRRNLGTLEMEKRETTVQLKQSHFQDLNIETRHRAAFPLHPLNPLSFSLPFSLSLSLSLSLSFSLKSTTFSQWNWAAEPWEERRDRENAGKQENTRAQGETEWYSRRGETSSEIEGGLQARHRRKGGNNGDCRSFRIARKLQTTSMHPPSFLYLQRSPPGETIAGSRYSCRQPRRIPTLLLFLGGSGRSFDLPGKL